MRGNWQTGGWRLSDKWHVTNKENGLNCYVKPFKPLF